MNYKEIINQNNGIIYFNKLKYYGLTRQDLNNMIKSGLVERIMHGIYASPDKYINEFWFMSEKYKNGIFSHNTALYFYNMTDRTPFKLDMTFPSNNRVTNDELKIHYIKNENYKLGATKLKLDDGTEINIYNLERTICDIIRDRNKIDPQIFNTALNEYVKRKDKDYSLLYKYAKIFKIEKILVQYMEVLQ